MERSRKWVPGFRAVQLILVIHLTLALEVPLDRKEFLLDLLQIIFEIVLCVFYI